MSKAGAQKLDSRRYAWCGGVFMGPRLCWKGDAALLQNEMVMGRSKVPPLEAYSRVTNAGRFAPLHDIASDLADRLEAEFDVVRQEGVGLDPELESRYELARPSVRLAPKTPDAAPLVFTFSKFPGVYLRLGRWYTAAFPSCGCDACNEAMETEAERLESLIDNVTAGRFREGIEIRDSGEAWSAWEVWSPKERSSSASMLDREKAQRLIGEGGRSSYEWSAWPGRT
jgi:hypothetical protein